MTSNGISAYIANLGKRSEGSPAGGWIDLPAPKEELDAFMREVVGVETDPQAAWEKSQAGEAVCEEYAIHEFEYAGALAKLGFSPREYEDIDDLNNLAWLVSDFDDPTFEAVRAAAEMGYPFADDALGFANLAAQADDIPFYGYGDVPDSWTPHEKLGRALVDGELQRSLERTGSAHLYDYESLGEELEAEAYTAYENGYLDSTQRLPDPERYDSQEIDDLASEKREQERGPEEKGRAAESVSDRFAAAEKASAAREAARAAAPKGARREARG